ncbi:MAG: tRNA threonylcarbamoyladenosine dehydratase [Oscillospiraceae bacterium]|nr:tRNA threonylcarbamoyladenosine dehydratase [Oscillospiraceae bacterium]
MTERFLRSTMLLGPAAMARLSRSHVCVVGLGGVGSWTAETLARAGVGELTLIDQDEYGESNINRQLGALTSSIGRPKAEVMAARILDINPACMVHPIIGKYDRDNRARFWGPYDLVADCIDLVACKVDLICQALERSIPILSALGTGNKLDPSLLEVTDLSKTYGCPLARVMRRELGRLGIRHLKVVYSPEEPACCAPLEAPPPGRRSVPGSVPWVPPVAGLLLGGAAVMELAGDLIPEKPEKSKDREDIG